LKLTHPVIFFSAVTRKRLVKISSICPTKKMFTRGWYCQRAAWMVHHVQQ
jgi:hypothetical protein